MPPFVLAHLSDPHLPPPGGGLALGEVTPKRLLSLLSWRRKRSRRHRPDILAALTADLGAHAPDHVAITGDLTNFATAREFTAARAWLERLGPARNVTVSPGNHDALSGGDGRFDLWRPWLGDERGPSEAEGFPYLRRRGPAALINLCSAVPTPPLMASGRLGADQIDRLEGLLRQARLEGLARVLLLHHPPARGTASWRKALTDSGALGAMLAREGAELVLHGHGHAALVSSLPGPQGAIPVLGVPSASAAPGGRKPPARWHAITVEPRGDGGFDFGVTVRGVPASGGEVVELGRYRLGAASLPR